ncbi:MAG: hypothetical protein KGQ48_10090 [Bradyrhizobium sp.]|nr:hypothetical protein [Bradyrhizobium sp.]
MLVIERKKMRQRKSGNTIFEFIQFKTILKREFEIIPNSNLKRSKPDAGNADRSHVFVHRLASIDAGRLHQRKQLVDAPLRDLPHAIGVFHSGDVDAFHHRPDLIAKICEEAQRIALIVGDARDQAGDQDLARDHTSIQFVHHVAPIE